MNQPIHLRLLLFPILYTLTSGLLNAQIKDRDRHFEAGIMLGATNYSGDLAEKIIEIAETQLGYGAYLRYQASNHFSIKFHGYSGSISGDDKHSAVLKERSFRFQTSFLELGLVGEVHFFTKPRYSRTGISKFRISPYLYGGIGTVFATADAIYYGPADRRNDYLRVPLPEDNLQNRFLLAPMGGGLRFDLSDQFILGLEGGFRPVFSDDLDGVKLNGNPDKGDWYYYTGATISYLFSKAGRGYPY
jgi:hypothetical protein